PGIVPVIGLRNSRLAHREYEMNLPHPPPRGGDDGGESINLFERVKRLSILMENISFTSPPRSFRA
ncbi:MAG: hypothetical protein VYB66_06690, partial [Verrucomicrobiota bacterium]|nr:hypothetical protein [Verrucomicrobiota bacterium]